MGLTVSLVISCIASNIKIGTPESCKTEFEKASTITYSWNSNGSITKPKNCPIEIYRKAIQQAKCKSKNKCKQWNANFVRIYQGIIKHYIFNFKDFTTFFVDVRLVHTLNVYAGKQDHLYSERKEYIRIKAYEFKLKQCI